MRNFLRKHHYPKPYAILTSIGFIALFIILLVLGSKLVLFFKEPLPKLYYGIFGTFSALLLLYVFLKIEHKTFASIGLKWENRTLLNLLTGILLGISIFMLMMLVLILFGRLYFQKINIDSYTNVCLSLLPFIPLTVMEELAFRTYPFLLLRSKLGIWNAQFIIAILFAAYHILMGWSIYIAFLGPFIWSFAFGWSALWSSGIAMPIGFHLALNWMQNLAGMKNEASSLYKLAYRSDSKELVATGEYLGIGMHIVILGVAIWLTNKHVIKATLK